MYIVSWLKITSNNFMCFCTPFKESLSLSSLSSLSVHHLFLVNISLSFQKQDGYRLNPLRMIVFISLAVLPAGMGLLAAYWFPYIFVRLICSPCSLEDATLVIVKVRVCVCVYVCVFQY